MVLQKIVQEIFRRGSPFAYKFLRSDKLVLDKVYTGFKHKSSIVSGIRHGLVAGSVAGGFISNPDDDDLNGTSLFEHVIKTGTPYQTRSRRRGRNNRRRCKCGPFNSNSRRSSYR